MIPRRENPAPRVNAGDRAYTKSEQATNSMKPAPLPDFAAVYVARRYRLPLSMAAVVARLANLAEVFS
jgi:hypothetical protein